MHGRRTNSTPAPSDVAMRAALASAVPSPMSAELRGATAAPLRNVSATAPAAAEGWSAGEPLSFEEMAHAVAAYLGLQNVHPLPRSRTHTVVRGPDDAEWRAKRLGEGREKNRTAMALADARYRELMAFSAEQECVLWAQLTL